MDKERLIALHTLSVITVIGGFLALFVSWVLTITIMPLHIYFAVHGARAAGAGRLASAAIALVAALPLVNTLMLVVVNNGWPMQCWPPAFPGEPSASGCFARRSRGGFLNLVRAVDPDAVHRVVPDLGAVEAALAIGVFWLVFP